MGSLTPGLPADLLLIPLLSLRLTWEFEFCILLFTVSTNIRLLNTERTVAQFSFCSSLTFVSKKNGFFSTFSCHPFEWNVGPSQERVCGRGLGFGQCLLRPLGTSAPDSRGSPGEEAGQLRALGKPVCSSWRQSLPGHRKGCRHAVGVHPGVPGPKHSESHGSHLSVGDKFGASPGV